MSRDNDSNIGTWLIVISLLGVAMYYGSHPKTTLAADGMDPTWDDAVAMSRMTGQPTVVLFTADWCGSCQWLHQNVLNRTDIRDELNRHYNFVTINLTNPTDRVQAHASKLGVSSIPTLIRYNPDGKETGREHGLQAKDMMEWLKAGE